MTNKPLSASNYTVKCVLDMVGNVMHIDPEVNPSLPRFETHNRR